MGAQRAFAFAVLGERHYALAHFGEEIAPGSADRLGLGSHRHVDFLPSTSTIGRSKACTNAVDAQAASSRVAATV
jgi:hypothetical protein